MIFIVSPSHESEIFYQIQNHNTLVLILLLVKAEPLPSRFSIKLSKVFCEEPFHFIIIILLQCVDVWCVKAPGTLRVGLSEGAEFSHGGVAVGSDLCSP